MSAHEMLDVWMVSLELSVAEIATELRQVFVAEYLSVERFVSVQDEEAPCERV